MTDVERINADANASLRLSPLKPAAPAAGRHIHWGSLPDTAAALALAETAKKLQAPLLIVTPDMAHASQLFNAVKFFADKALSLDMFPDWETLAYDVFSPLPELVSERLSLMLRLPQMKQGIIIAPVNTLMQRLSPRSYVMQSSFELKPGDTLVLEDTRRQLENASYQCVPQVYSHGEFAVRGALLDLFPMGSDVPFRIDLLDDEVDSIRTFDPETQRTIEKVDAIHLLPAREFPFDEHAIKSFRSAWRNTFDSDPNRSLIYRDVSEGHLPGGLEYYLPLFFEQTSHVFDYLPEHSCIAHFGDLNDTAQTIFDEISERYEQRRHDIERPLLAPERLFLRPDELMNLLKTYEGIKLQTHEIHERRRGYESFANYACRPLPPLAIQARHSDPAGALKSFAREFNGRILFLAESNGRREILRETLSGFGLKPGLENNWPDFLVDNARLSLTVSEIETGFIIDSAAIAVVPESALFGQRVQQRRRRKKVQRDAADVVRDLTELAIGTAVVHEDHGIGRYLGLTIMNVNDIDTEFLALEYARGDKLYVPVADIHLISRYSGTASENAPLHRLGGEQWSKIRKKAAQKARDVAAELLQIYAQREAKPGIAFSAPDIEYNKFASEFEFEETPDQESTISAVLDDMERTRPMDRVVCGDVGFGKTEVAMRAAFIAVNSNRQVVVLVPTTLLAQQHFENFSDRFADWPVKIANLSRFTAGKQQKAVLAGLADGSIDIIIGTHKLLSPEIKYKQLGLVIIDEEHRFGVRHKDKLKALRANVDLLTLTATPIPRTLNMAMSGLRDLSVIATPPVARHPVKTFVAEWNDALIVEACERELKRGGQIYFLHNEVSTIENMAEKLVALVPAARVGVAHGQMRERKLETVMRDFYHQRHNLLVCTTIVESGIDVPSANTILIHRADKLGLAQLHQLRGRVGRSHHRAYAYLIVPPRKAMTADAVKRIDAIESLETLGAGFTLASHDLEIRGAGELLGEDQSGQIQEVGYTLYNELLERAVKSIRSGETADFDAAPVHGTEIDLQIPALIPADYLPDVHTRLVLYKKIANATDSETLREIQVEMIDRFGLLPPPLKNLFAIAQLKFKTTPMGIRSIDASPSGARFNFSDTPQIDAGKLIELIQKQPQQYKLEGNEKLRIIRSLEDGEKRIDQIHSIVDQISAR